MIFTKNFVFTSLINFFVSMAYYMLFVVSTPYAIDMFHTSTSVSGLVAGLILIGCLCGRLVAGRIVNDFGFRKMIFVGLGIYIVSLALYLVVHELYTFMALRFISGIGVGCIGTVASVIIVHIIPREYHGRGINYFSLSAVLAMAIGPFAGIWMMEHVSFNVIFSFCLLVGIIALVLALFLRYPHVPKPVKEGAPKRFDIQNYISYSAIPVSFVALLMMGGYGSLQAFLPVYAKTLDLSKAAGVFFIIYAVAALATRPFTGKTFDKRGANIIIYPSLIATAVGFVILCYADSAFWMLTSALFLGLGIANFQTTAQAVCVKLSHGHGVAQSVSTFFIFMDLGIGVGPYLYGFLEPTFGYHGLYATCAGVAIATILIYRQVYGKHAYAM
jgi:MFS family permease